LAIPIFFFLSAFALVYESTHNLLKVLSYRVKADMSSWKGHKSDDEANHHTEVDPTVGPSTAKDTQDASDVVTNNAFSPVSLHLHHWQIFYVLCFFTR
jgi:hypothetical protein